MTLKRTRRTRTKLQGHTALLAPEPPTQAARTTKLDRMVRLLQKPEGASLAELVTATGWQHHSVRGALAGALKKKGYQILSQRSDGERRYRIEAA
jgi:hypothetical protein